MGKLRERMRQELAPAGYAPDTQDHDLGAARRFVRRFRLPPEPMGQEPLHTHVARSWARAAWGFVQPAFAHGSGEQERA
jgi:hypothetical protein